MAVHGADISARLALDAQGVDQLRAQAKNDPQRALKSAARQFEALFMHMMLKSMREATPQDGPFESEQTRLYTSMLDQQLAQTLSSRGLGLADIMVKQLTRGQTSELPALTGIAPQEPAAATAEPQPPAAPAAPAAAPGAGTRSGDPVRDFTSRHGASAEAAAQATGIPARFLLAQAGLESGWGRREIRGADGAETHNIFGIKAGRNWKGRTVEAATTEYIDGKPVRTVERFRAYDSYADAFRDYGRLIANSPRYAHVRDRQDEVAFAYGLQRAGYATDPRYADKLIRVIGSIRSRYSTTA